MNPTARLPNAPRLTAFGRVLAAGEAWTNLNETNRRSRWADVLGSLRSGIVLAEAARPFAIEPRDSILCVGSCFAKNVEKQLLQLGFNVLSRQIPRVAGQMYLSTLPHVFNPWSITNEFRWALDPGRVFPDEAYLVDDAGSYYDPHGDANLLQCSRETARNRRQAITETFRHARCCRVVIVTLGLVEAWFDNHTGLFVNAPLPRQLMEREPGRFTFHVLNHAGCLTALEELHALLTRHGHPDFHLIVTVSPQPLKATFTEQDVLVANTASKATLRSATQDFALAHDNVHYLPTYENVMLSDRAAAWEEDLRHVTDRMVNLNMLNFVSRFVNDPAAAQQARSAVEAACQSTQSSAQSPDPVRAPVPDFWSAAAGGPDFPGGFPRVEASSSLNPEYDAGALMSAPRRIWHSQQPPRFPEWLTLHFPQPLCCRTLWLRAQQTERAPTQFTLEGSSNGSEWMQLLTVTSAQWTRHHAWQAWPVPNERAWKHYRLVVHANGGSPELLAIRKLWLSPHSLHGATSPAHAQTPVTKEPEHSPKIFVPPPPPCPAEKHNDYLIELDEAAPSTVLQQIPALLADGKVVVLRNLSAVRAFRDVLIDCASNGAERVRAELLAFYERGIPLNVEVMGALSDAIKWVREQHILSQHLGPLVAKMGFPGPVLLDGGISRLVLPRELVEQARADGRFAPTDFKRERADGPVEVFMPGQANIHRDFNREHFLFQCNLWFPLHDADESEVLRLFPQVYRQIVFDMDASPENLARLGPPLRYQLKFGDVVMFHGENLHTSPSHAQTNYRRHTFDLRVATHCPDDNAHYRYNFLNLANFLPHDRREPTAIQGLNELRKAGPFARPNAELLLTQFLAAPFAEDRLLALATSEVRWTPQVAAQAAIECAQRSEHYFWVLKAGESLAAQGRIVDARTAWQRARDLAAATKSLPDYMPVRYTTPHRQLLPKDAVARAEQCLAKLP